MSDNSTTVSNVKVAHIRPEYNDLNEWMRDSNNVYIGRRGIVFINGTRFPLMDSVWCNPYKIEKHGDRDEVLALYKEYILDKINNDDVALELLLFLRGKNLGCWCAPEPCHGNILKDIIEMY